MFGLKNFKGSCWVNACLQAYYRVPEVQQRYMSNKFEKANIIDECLYKIYKSKGQDGLKDLFDAVHTDTMPAGKDIGDSHELFSYLCDKLPFLDHLCRFKTADVITCSKCQVKDVKEDSVTEYSLTSNGKFIPLSECISNTVVPVVINDWSCSKCNNKGCTKQQLIGSFPKVMVFHMVTPQASVNYSTILILNNKKYALLSIVCYTGGHWLTHGRFMPPGSPWYTFDDEHIQEHTPKQFPVSNKMRLLIYYRLED